MIDTSRLAGGVSCWLADGLGTMDTTDLGVGVEECWRWVWWIGGGECVESVWNFKVVEKVGNVCVIGVSEIV